MPALELKSNRTLGFALILILALQKHKIYQFLLENR